MGIFVALKKESEDDGQVTYRYGPGRSCSGSIRFNKVERSVEVLEEPSQDPERTAHAGAMHAIVKAASNDEKFPDHMTHSA